MDEAESTSGEGECVEEGEDVCVGGGGEDTGFTEGVVGSGALRGDGEF